VSNVIRAEKIALFVGRDSRQGETGNSRTMVRAGIAASACKPMRALQAHPAESAGKRHPAGCCFA